MTRNIYILLIYVLYFVLTPNISFARGSEIEKTCCKKESLKKSELKIVVKKNCCKEKKSELKDKNDCDGQCGDKYCKCISYHLDLILPLSTEINNLTFYFFRQKTDADFYLKTSICSGFYFIWTPPKISRIIYKQS